MSLWVAITVYTLGQEELSFYFVVAGGPYGGKTNKTAFLPGFCKIECGSLVARASPVAPLSGTYICFLSGWSWAEIKFTVHVVDLPKRHIN